MSFIKKVAAFVLLMAICGYAAQKWDAHTAFERTGEKLVRQLGDNIVSELSRSSASCRTNAVIDGVTFKSEWLLADKASAVLYISGKNGSAISLEYGAESAGEKVYVKPKDASANQLEVMRFRLNGCS